VKSLRASCFSEPPDNRSCQSDCGCASWLPSVPPGIGLPSSPKASPSFCIPVSIVVGIQKTGFELVWPEPLKSPPPPPPTLVAPFFSPWSEPVLLPLFFSRTWSLKPRQRSTPFLPFFGHSPLFLTIFHGARGLTSAMTRQIPCAASFQTLCIFPAASKPPCFFFWHFSSLPENTSFLLFFSASMLFLLLLASLSSFATKDHSCRRRLCGTFITHHTPRRVVFR